VHGIHRRLTIRNTGTILIRKRCIVIFFFLLLFDAVPFFFAFGIILFIVVVFVVRFDEAEASAVFYFLFAKFCNGNGISTVDVYVLKEKDRVCVVVRHMFEEKM
jgi:hypothetical protein